MWSCVLRLSAGLRPSPLCLRTLGSIQASFSRWAGRGGDVATSSQVWQRRSWPVDLSFRVLPEQANLKVVLNQLLHFR